MKDGHVVYRLWKDGAAGQEYFLVENRQRSRYDQGLPGAGLLIWHIDDAISNNTDESHYRVALEQADGDRDLENNANRGDDGDPWPGSGNKRAFTNTSTPNSQSYGGINTCVAVTSISDSGPTMTAHLQVRCGKTVTKDTKDHKDARKEAKEWTKDRWEKRWSYDKERLSEKFRWEKRPEKPEIDKSSTYDKGFFEKGDQEKGRQEKFADKATDGGFDWRRNPEETTVAELEARIAALEAELHRGPAPGAPFIGEDLRPDLSGSALRDEPDGGPGTHEIDDKRSFDSPT